MNPMTASTHILHVNAPIRPKAPAPIRCALARPGLRLFGALLLACATTAHSAEPGPSSSATTTAAASAACNDAAPMPVEQLLGLWQLTLWPEAGSADQPVSQGAVLFEPHPEYPGSVRGRLKRSGPGNDLQALLSGDVVNGEFNLDESDDGVRMTAVWVGTPQNCGRRLQGVRDAVQTDGAADSVLRFELRKARD